MKHLAVLVLALHIPVITPTDKPMGDSPPRIDPDPMPHVYLNRME